MAAPEISPRQLAKHGTPSDCWVAINGIVYDMTEFATSHPGGISVLMEYAGRDATDQYKLAHPDSLVAETLGDKCVGRLVSPELRPPSDPKPPISSPAPAAVSGRKVPLSTLLSAHDFARVAHATYPLKTLAFLSSAATDKLTHRANTATYAKITLRPRVLRLVGGPISLSTTLLSQPVPSPVFAAPTSLGKTVHPEGEAEIARGCAHAGTAQVISTSASCTLSEIFTARKGAGGTNPVFFQLYVDKDRMKSERLVREAVDRGVKGVFVTVDAPVVGKREEDERVAISQVPVPHPSSIPSPSVSAPMSGVSASQNDKTGGGLGRIIGSYVDASLSWSDIPWLRSLLSPSGTPLVLKGIQTATDAKLALDAGVQGIVISNHGGRSLDTAPPTILVLLELHRCCPEVFERMDVFIDGGVMRGTDVFKALCLGARGVGVGRGVLYALGYGAEGVRRYSEILNDELETTMRMCGITSLDQVHPGLLNTRAVDHLIPSSLDPDHPYIKWRPRQKL